MLALTPSHSTRSRARPGSATLLAAATALLAAACATQRTGAPAAVARPQVLTVPQLQSKLEMGTPVNVLFGEIQGSGTVYRLTPEQRTGLRASGMPASLLSQLQLTYEHAVKQNPDLARSDAKWTQVDGYWYGGLPYGWPREWVIGAPPLGEKLR